MKNFGLKNLTVALLGAGMVTMAFDAGLAHFAGGTVKHAAQLIPIGFGVVAVATALALLDISKRWLLRISRLVAGTSAAVGLLGTAYHAAALMRTLSTSGSPDWGMLGVALTIAPPLLAPGAFVGLGAALWALASPRVDLKLKRRAVAHA